MTSRESATAAARAGSLFRIAEKEPNVHDPWMFMFRMEFDTLVGAMLQIDADSEQEGA